MKYPGKVCAQCGGIFTGWIKRAKFCGRNCYHASSVVQKSHREKCNEYEIRWKKKNPDKVKAKQQRTYAKRIYGDHWQAALALFELEKTTHINTSRNQLNLMKGRANGFDSKQS